MNINTTIDTIKSSSSSSEPKKPIRLRVANIMQYEEYLSEEKIKLVLSSYKSIDKFAYIKHDKDIDVETGELKKPHWHIVIQFKTPQYLHLIAQWFGIEQQYIEIPKGRNAFIECVKYLTHSDKKQQDLGKHKYDDNEVISNFDFLTALDDYSRSQITKGEKGKKLALRQRVITEGLKLSEIDPIDYVNDMTALQFCRKEYLKFYAKLPDTRVNFYIQGGSGAGKSFSSRALAKSLVDPFDEKPDNEVYFVAGQGASMFQNYDGQPVIIFDDIRSWDLLNYYNKSASAIFNLFDIIPSKSDQNIKFGSIKLINTYFIVNGMQPFEEFVADICYRAKESGLPEPDKQMYRRFLAKFNVKPFDYDFFINEQYFNPEEKNYKLYKSYENIGIKCGIIEASKKWGDTKKFVELRNKHFELPTKTAKEAIEYHAKPETNEEILTKEFDSLMSEETQYTFSLVDSSEYGQDKPYSSQMNELLIMKKQIEEKINALKFKTFNPDLENQTGQNGQNFSQDASQIFNSKKPPF